jgi:small subunit ribosomal protein S1
LTDEQQGGPMTPAEAAAEAPSSEPSVATTTVADEPADAAPAASVSTTETPDTNEPAMAEAPSEEPATEEPAPAEATAEEAAAEAPAAEAQAPATAPVEEAAAPAAMDAAPGDAPEHPMAAAEEPMAAAEAPMAAAEASPVAAAEAPSTANGEKRASGPEPTTMEELLAETDGEIKSFKHGDVVEGTVVRIDKDEILVDIGAKSEGVVSNRELFGRNTEAQSPLNVGDTVLVYVLQPESPEGHVVLSLRRAGLERKWRAMQEQFEAGAIIEAPVIDHNKGGLIVDCGIRGFVPISQIVDFPRRPQNDQPRDAAQEIAEKLQPFVGRKLRLKILEVNRKANRLILSEKVALYEERREKRDELFSSLKVGQKVTGTVRSIAPFGVFIDLGGIDGLVHKSELSWNKVNNPEAGYHVGEEVEAEVIDINHERGRISLSIRRLQPDPWHSTVADFNVGDIIDGTVTKLVNFGAFVRVRDGLEGLIHISELSHQRVAHPGDVVHEGQLLKLRIISLESERHRLGLSLKQAEEAPARPAPEPVTTAPVATAAASPAPSRPARPERRERSGRGERERSFSASDAVQEPEGGIDTTLAAAFAGVREQIAAAEAAETPADAMGAGETADPPAAEAPAAEAPTAEAAPVAMDEAPAAEVVEAAAPEAPAAEPVEAPAAEAVEAAAPEAPAADAEAEAAPMADAEAEVAPMADADAEAAPMADAEAEASAEDEAKAKATEPAGDPAG